MAEAMPHGTAMILRKLGLAGPARTLQPLRETPCACGQSYPRGCPQSGTIQQGDVDDPLGEPLTIQDAALIIGCSPWTIRQKYIPAGLPYHRVAPKGKLIFYRKQIIRWVTQRQKGGKTP